MTFDNKNARYRPLFWDQFVSCLYVPEFITRRGTPSRVLSSEAVDTRRHPFRKGDGWAVWGGIGILLAPFVVAGTAFLVSAAGYPVCPVTSNTAWCTWRLHSNQTLHDLHTVTHTGSIQELHCQICLQ